MPLNKADIININNKRTARRNGTLYVSTMEMANKYKINKTRMCDLIKNGRVKGVYKIGNAWAIPSDWVYIKMKKCGPRKYMKKRRKPRKVIRTSMVGQRSRTKLKDPSIP